MSPTSLSRACAENAASPQPPARIAATRRAVLVALGGGHVLDQHRRRVHARHLRQRAHHLDANRLRPEVGALEHLAERRAQDRIRHRPQHLRQPMRQLRRRDRRQRPRRRRVAMLHQLDQPILGRLVAPIGDAARRRRAHLGVRVTERRRQRRRRALVVDRRQRPQRRLAHLGRAMMRVLQEDRDRARVFLRSERRAQRHRRLGRRAGVEPRHQRLERLRVVRLAQRRRRVDRPLLVRVAEILRQRRSVGPRRRRNQNEQPRRGAPHQCESLPALVSSSVNVTLPE
jgi:hypothetical protein